MNIQQMHIKKHTEETKRKISESQKGKRYSVKTEFKKGMKPWNKGKKLSKKHVKNLVKSHMGQNAWNKGKKCPQISNTLKEIERPDIMGEKNFNWKGGITPELKLLRCGSLYRIWREGVFLRDNFTCQECGKLGGYLEAHHIKSFADYPTLRFDISNGFTCCLMCHCKIDKHRCIKNVA